MPDGSHWAVQEWTRIKPNFGGRAGDRELRVAHWRGDVAQLEIHTDWSKYHDGRGNHWHHMFGRYTYNGKGVYGKRTTPTGVPLDDLGRNLYVDSLDSDYGAGWLRVNAFVSRRPMGQFCFEFGPKSGFGERAEAGTGRSGRNQYRAGIIGPGVTPDVFLSFTGPGDIFDPVIEEQMNQLQRDLVGNPAYGCGDPRRLTGPRGGGRGAPIVRSDGRGRGTGEAVRPCRRSRAAAPQRCSERRSCSTRVQRRRRGRGRPNGASDARGTPRRGTVSGRRPPVGAEAPPRRSASPRRRPASGCAPAGSPPAPRA